jgi:hypothetical protein
MMTRSQWNKAAEYFRDKQAADEERMRIAFCQVAVPAFLVFLVLTMFLP